MLTVFGSSTGRGCTSDARGDGNGSRGGGAALGSTGVCGASGGGAALSPGSGGHSASGFSCAKAGTASRLKTISERVMTVTPFLSNTKGGVPTATPPVQGPTD